MVHSVVCIVNLHMVAQKRLCLCSMCHCGVIDVVPDSMSGGEIVTQVSLREYFHSVYGAT